MIDEKVCRKCGETKPLELFSRDRSRADGRRNACKACDAIHNASPDRVAARVEYGKTDAARAAWRKYRRTERGAANNRKHYERVKDTPEHKRRMEGYMRKWQSSEKGRIWMRAYSETEQRRAWKREYRWRPAVRQRIRESARAYMARRESLAALLPATLTIEEWFVAVEHFGGCAYCGARGRMHQDHFIPLSAGGPYTAQNIIPACQRCNSSKHDRMPEQWCSPESYAAITAYFASLGC